MVLLIMSVECQVVEYYIGGGGGLYDSCGECAVQAATNKFQFECSLKSYSFISRVFAGFRSVV